MSKQTRVSHPIYSILPTEVEGFGPLAELALDMRSSWDHATDQVSADRAPADYTARIIPHSDGVTVPLEEAHILWQR